MILRNTFKKKLLLFLAAAADYWYENFSFYSYHHPYLAKMNKDTTYSTVSRLVSVGEIEKIIKKGKAYLRLTSKGFNKLKQDIPLFKFSRAKWDGLWRMVIFDIPEQKRVLRDALRHKLLALGLGQWQKSIYITPFPLEEEINEFLKAKNIFGLAFCMKAKRLGRGDDRQIANLAFKLKRLNGQYYQFLDDDLGEAEVLFQQGKLKLSMARKLIDKYLELILKDPGLPRELLPKVWWADNVKKDFPEFMLNLKASFKRKP